MTPSSTIIRYKDDTSFQNALKTEVLEPYFNLSNRRKTGDYRLYMKTAILITFALLLYVFRVFLTPESFWLRTMLDVFQGLSFSCIGFNVMHDASHFSYSTKMWVNKTMVLSLDAMSASSHNWITKHVSNHHRMTNTPADDDIDLYPIVRIRQTDKWLWFHRYQAIYAPLILYPGFYLAWIFYLDFRKYFLGKVGNTKIKKMKPIDQAIFWGSKIISLFLLIGLPALRLGFGVAVVDYLIMAGTVGLTISMVFQLAHVVETSTFPLPHKETGMIETPWAVSQVMETTDFATKNKLITWLFGGLNFQTIHHLFPKVSHVHYPALQAKFIKVCNEFKIKYNHLSFFGAIKSHFRHLAEMAKMPQLV